MDLDLYVFSSTSRKNIEIGVQHRLWAVPVPSELPVKSQLVTKSQAMRVGAQCIFYCSGRKAFTVPFVVESRPDPKTVNDIWAGQFFLSFKIKPMGPVGRWLDKDRAEHVLPTLRAFGGRWCDKLLVAPGLVFLPSHLDSTDWDALVAHLAPEF